MTSREKLIENRNKNREPEAEFSPEQQTFIENPFASRQKLAPRYTHDIVMADLPIHIYTKKKRGPIAKARLKRVPKSAKLLQTAGDHLILGTSRTQEIKLESLQDGPGILPFNMGFAKIISPIILSYNY